MPDKMRIVVIMLGLLGDVLMRTPVLREIRKIWPNAKVTCIADEIGAEVLRLSPDIDEVLVMSRARSSLLQYLREKVQVLSRLNASPLDLIIDLYGGSSSRLIVSLSRARKKLVIHSGIVTAKGLTHIQDFCFDNPYHLSNTPLRALGYLPTSGNVSLDTRPHIDLDHLILEQSELRCLDDAVASGPAFLVSMGSGDYQKIIDLRVVSELCGFAFSQYGLMPMVVRNPGQENIQADICAYMKARSVPHIKLPSLSIPAIAHLIRRVRFVMVPDTGLFHLAVGLGAPVLGIFTHTNPELVRPSAGDVEICFKEDLGQGLTKEGLSYGAPGLELDYLKDGLAKLLARRSGEPA